jgi:hypothetical protein
MKMKPARSLNSAARSRALGDGQEPPLMTGKDLLESGLIGMWRKRKDIRSSTSFARRLRTRVSKRKPA